MNNAETDAKWEEFNAQVDYTSQLLEQV